MKVTAVLLIALLVLLAQAQPTARQNVGSPVVCHFEGGTLTCP